MNKNRYFTNDIESNKLQLLVNDYGNWDNDGIFFEFHEIIAMSQNDETFFVITENGSHEFDLDKKGIDWELVEDGILWHYSILCSDDELTRVNQILEITKCEKQIYFLQKRKNVLSLQITT